MHVELAYVSFLTGSKSKQLTKPSYVELIPATVQAAYRQYYWLVAIIFTNVNVKFLNYRVKKSLLVKTCKVRAFIEKIVR